MSTPATPASRAARCRRRAPRAAGAARRRLDRRRRVRCAPGQATDPSKQPRHEPSLRPVPEVAVGAVSETLKRAGTAGADSGRRHDVPAGAHRQRGAEGAGAADAAAEAGRAGRPCPRRRPGVPLARQERDAWAGWPARVAALMAADLGIGAHAMQTVLESMPGSTSGRLADSGLRFRDGRMRGPCRPRIRLADSWPSTAPKSCCAPGATGSRRTRSSRSRRGRTPSGAEPARRQRGGPVAHRADAVPAGADGRAVSPRHPAQRVVVMKGAQIGASESGCNWIGYVIHHAPGPMLAVQPTVELAKRFSQQRIDPLIEESPVAAREGGAGAVARRRQYRAVEGVPRRHPGDDRRQLGGRPALDAGALPVPRRGRRLSAVGRRRGRAGGAGRGADADLLVAAQGVPGLDADDQGTVADRARVRGLGPAAVLRAVSAVR